MFGPSCATTRVHLPLSVIFLITVAGAALALSSSGGDPVSAAEGVLSRVYPSLVGRVSFEVIDCVLDSDSTDCLDVYEIEGDSSGVILRGNNAVALCSALGWYARYSLNTQYSWTGDQLELPSTLPQVENVRVVSPSKYSYYMNTCTHSYSAAWWDWARWEREIDWMALNGVNLPLAFAGQEYVWRAVFTKMGLTMDEINSWLTGPAFLAWFRMGNLQTWAGPLSDNWIDEQYNLQLLILQRMRDIGMTPVLPMFAAHVPEALKEYYPDAQIIQASTWADFNATYSTWFLEPTDPLFRQIGTLFLQIQNEVYGTDHIYNGDLYNELTPEYRDTDYLYNASNFVYSTMAEVDPQGIWLMQGWLFENQNFFWMPKEVEAYLSGVPDENMIILDLWTEQNPVWQKFDSYYGKKWIWCFLHNFGGNPGMYGNLTHVLTQPYLDRVTSPSMSGVGLTMEGISQNYILYEAMLESKWRSDPVEDVDDWVTQYVHRRYGPDAPDNAVNAWLTLLQSIYSSWSLDDGHVIEVRPSIDNMDSPAWTSDSWKAWELLCSSDVEALYGQVETYKNDVVDLGRQALADHFLEVFANLRKGYHRSNLTAVIAAGSELQEIILDLDSLFLTHQDWLLGTWIQGALSWANTGEEEFYEFNARNQVTMWGYADTSINDYAKKAWQGLYSDYYVDRWALFVDYVTDAVETGKVFNHLGFNRDCVAIEEAWQTETNTFPATPQGDTTQIANSLITKYQQN